MAGRAGSRAREVRKELHGLGEGAGGFAASGAAGGALDEAEARRLARDTVPGRGDETGPKYLKSTR